MNKLLHCLLYLNFIYLVESAVVRTSNNVTDTGLYGPADRVVVLTKANFEANLYGKSHAWLIEFYNSYCGFCIKYSAIFKPFAAEVYFWSPVVTVGVMDCSDDANNDICRDFEILRYPTMRYFHHHYEQETKNLGEDLIAGPTPEAMTTILVNKLKDDEESGIRDGWPKLTLKSYNSYAEALEDLPANIKVTFIIFEKANSTTCAEVALDTIDYERIVVKCVSSLSKLSQLEAPSHFPSIYAVKPNLSVTPLTPKNNTRANLVYAINVYMKNNKLALPHREVRPTTHRPEDGTTTPSLDISEKIYRTDLEASLRFLLTHEITTAKTVTGDARNALIEFLSVLIDLFPFAANGKVFITELRNIIKSKDTWNGSELKKIIHDKELELSPVYGTNAEWYGCKGSTPHLRGYTCGLWQLFHMLTVSAARSNQNGPRVLKAMHGYISNFFGCYDCQKHFLAMSEKNKLFEVSDNRKAVLWLWISHNEVNLRLAGDGSEDPHHPKVQFPTERQCSECRDSVGSWNLEEVYAYLKTIYNPLTLKERDGTNAPFSSAPLDNTDFGLLTILYFACFCLLVLLGRVFFCKPKKKYYAWNKY